MAALSFGFDELERRLELIRSRCNLFALQDALYKAGAFVLTSGAVVLVAAAADNGKHGRPMTLAYLALSLAVLAHFALRLRRRWLSLDDTAELADRAAHLDCRLATMLAHRKSPTRSRLRALLLSEVFLLASRWTVQRVAPRRIPKSIAVFAAALLLFTIAFLLAPRPPEPTTAATTANNGAAAEPQLAAANSSTDGGLAAAGSREATGATTNGHRNAGSQSSAGKQPRSAPGDGSAAAPGENGAAPAAGAAGSAPGIEGEASGADKRAAKAATPADDAAGRGKTQPAEAARANNGERGPSDRPRAAERKGGRDVASRGHGSGDENGHPPQSQRPSREASNGPAKARQSGSESKDAKGGSRAERASTAGPAEKSGLYGSAKEDGAPPSDAAAMLIKLTAFSAVAPQEFERQGRGDAGAAATDENPADEAAPLADQLNRETPLLRAPLDVEHEAIVRDIFTPRQ